MREPKKLKTSSSKSIEKRYKAYLIRFVLPGVAVAIIAGYSLAQSFNKPIDKAGPGIVEDLSAYTLKETRPTLSPALFQGKIARAYQIAREMPKVLDQLYCYCRCEDNFGHKSLLSCYVDQHGAN